MGINNWGEAILTSIRGRRLGLDSDNYLVGSRGVREGLETATSGTTLSAHGLSIFNSTAATAIELPPPTLALRGVKKSCVCTVGSSAAIQNMKLTAGNFQTSAGSSFTTAQFTTAGQSLELQYISTALVQVLANMGAIAFTTTT